MVPEIRRRSLNQRPKSSDGKYVLYWMTAFRRASWNFTLDRAIELAAQLGRPLLVVEPLRHDYRWASDRMHQFVINGMADNQAAFQGKPVEYFPYVEPKSEAGKGMIEAFVEDAAAVVVDDYPCFFIPKLNRLVAVKSPVAVEAVDSNGLLPLRAADKVHSRAHFFRTFLQRNLKSHLMDFPQANPFKGVKLPKFDVDLSNIRKRWKPADLKSKSKIVETLGIDHSVKVIAGAGGSSAGQQLIQELVETKIESYPDERNKPEQNATSGLSPYLHFGHVSSHEVFSSLMDADGWDPGKIADEPTKKVEGWWGCSEPLEPFLDQLTTWREIGLNMAWQDPHFDRYESLPPWAQKTLAEHAQDKRDPCYTLEQFESAETHDDLWNAAQNQLITEGRIHNYLRMLWGKKILHWSESPEAALEIMIELNNKYALDGRDPNSYSGIFWTLGRYDRAWGPERPIFGKIRYMTSENTARKYSVKRYIRSYSKT